LDGAIAPFLTFNPIALSMRSVMDSSSFELTLEQQFQMRMMEQSTQKMTREQMQDTLIQAARLLMVKDNVIRDLIKSCSI
jgi:hypothetical protein